MGLELPFLGLLLSLGLIALTGVYPGGIIVPSYLVLFFEEPQRLVGTGVAALLTLWVYLLVSRYLILFGRRRFVFLVLVGGVWALAWRNWMPFLFPASQEYTVIGWVVPGLIANQFERQGVLLTLGAMLTATVALAWVGRLLGLGG